MRFDSFRSRSFETHSLPSSLAATHRGLAFYVAFPKSSIRPVGLSSTSHVSLRFRSPNRAMRTTESTESSKNRGSAFEKKEPRDGTHHAAPKTAPITYAMPSVASVGSSITDVTANPLSAWKAAIASRVIGPSTPSIAPP